ncbi:MAG: hypothetical protein P8I55_02235 [Crocinitomix sp.]|nr:hypothetical protein [Crocinitomix sp.]
MNTDNIFFNLCHPILERLKDGGVLKTGFSYFFYILGGAAILGGIILGAEPFQYIVNIWSIIGFAATAFAGWMVFQICWFRAKSIKSVPDSEFVVSAIFSIFIRSIGEIIATVLVVLGFTTGLVALFSDIPSVSDVGVAGIVIGPVVGFLVIAVFYFIAERLSALPAIAVNTSSKDTSTSVTS